MLVAQVATEARRTGAQLEKARKEAKLAKNASKTPRKSSKLSEEDKEELNEVDEVEKDEMAELERRRRREERHRRRRSSAHTATIQAAVSLPSFSPTTFLRRLDKNGLWRQLPVEDRAMQAIGLPVEYAWLLKYMVWLLGGLIFGRVLRALP